MEMSSINMTFAAASRLSNMYKNAIYCAISCIFYTSKGFDMLVLQKEQNTDIILYVNKIDDAYMFKKAYNPPKFQE